MQAETAWTFKGTMLIEHRRLLTLYKKTLLIFSYFLKAKYKFSIGRWIANLFEKSEDEFTAVLLFISSQ